MTKQDLPPDVRATMKLFAEAQIDRVAEMSPAELDDALRAQGLDPNEPFDFEEMLAKLPEAPSKPAPVASLPVVSLASRRARTRWELWLIAAAFGALGLSTAVVLATSPPGASVIADNDEPPPPPGPSEALVRAEHLRDDAERACLKQLWGTCEQKLDDARALDPAGEGQERVRQWRKAISISKMPREPGSNKPDPNLMTKPDLEPRRPHKP